MLFRGFVSTGDVNRVLLLLWFLVGLGLFSLLVPAAVKFVQGDRPGALIVIGAGLFLAGASTLGGSGVGFLFGVPRRDEGGPDSNDRSKEPRDSGYRPNTNLEHISDWLTKIIVGVGLTQLSEIVELVKQLGRVAGPAFGSTPSGEIIAISLVFHYTLVGFFQGFLLAYLWLPGAFSRAVQEMKERETTGAAVANRDEEATSGTSGSE